MKVGRVFVPVIEKARVNQFRNFPVLFGGNESGNTAAGPLSDFRMENISNTANIRVDVTYKSIFK